MYRTGARQTKPSPALKSNSTAAYRSDLTACQVESVAVDDNLIVRPMKPMAHGFTLVEMIVTIGIVALLLGLAVPSFIELSRNNRMTGAANDLRPT